MNLQKHLWPVRRVQPMEQRILRNIILRNSAFIVVNSFYIYTHTHIYIFFSFVSFFIHIAFRRYAFITHDPALPVPNDSLVQQREKPRQIIIIEIDV